MCKLEMNALKGDPDQIFKHLRNAIETFDMKVMKMQGDNGKASEQIKVDLLLNE